MRKIRFVHEDTEEIFEFKDDVKMICREFVCFCTKKQTGLNLSPAFACMKNNKSMVK